MKLVGMLPLVKATWPFTAGSAGLSASSAKPNIIVLVFDTLSAKHMSLYGYPRRTTPNMDRFAERATVYHSCYSAGNFTTPGTASLLTGVYPWTHRALHLHGEVTEPFDQRSIFSMMPDAYHKVAYTHNLLVASLLHQFRGDISYHKPTRDLCIYDDQISDQIFPNDYNASFWSEWLTLRGNNPNPGSLFLSAAHRGLRFAHKADAEKRYGESFPRGIPNLHNLHFVLEDAIDWIGEQLTELPHPYFAYFHLLPPHEPYMARRDFVDRFEDSWQPQEKSAQNFSQGFTQQELNRERRLYDEYLAYADHEFGRLVDEMERSGTFENSYVILTSDHGEMFERGIRGHVTPTLYDPVVHVPMLISKPGQFYRQDIFTTVSTVDLAPSLLHVTGQNIPTWLEGYELPGIAASHADGERSVYSMDAKSNGKYAKLEKASVALTSGSHRLIEYMGYEAKHGDRELYDLASDPEELRDLADTSKALLGNLQTQMREQLQLVASNLPIG